MIRTRCEPEHCTFCLVILCSIVPLHTLAFLFLRCSLLISERDGSLAGTDTDADTDTGAETGAEGMLEDELILGLDLDDGTAFEGERASGICQTKVLSPECTH